MREDEPGVLKSAHALNALITAEVDAGVPASRIVLGGFSQGGAMTLFTGLTNERRLAGLAVLSGYAAVRHTLAKMISDHARKVPIFWGHGTADPVVRFDVAEASREWLKGVGVTPAKATGEAGLDWHAYPGVQHSTSPTELKDLVAFLTKVLPKQE
jgi:predicted esterase